MAGFDKEDESLRMELAVLGNDDLFLADLRELKSRYPDRYLKHYLMYQEQWHEIAFRIADRFSEQIHPSYLSFREECRMKRLVINAPTVQIQFERDAVALCKKWCLRWTLDLEHRAACRWVSTVLLSLKQADVKPDLTTISDPPKGLVLPIVNSAFKPLCNVRISRPCPHASEVQIIARSSVGKRDLEKAAKGAYDSLRRGLSIVSNKPERRKGGRPGIPTRLREIILDEFRRKIRSHRGTNKDLIRKVSQLINQREGRNISTKSYEKILATAQSQMRPTSSPKRYMTVKLDQRT